ncbi:uncharacterized protein LOC131892582 [Tigriopus californicus]|uniref:uncharacterized protein LOC131892582 n=1 Tax=Tigriopus californicus TaxID=6832 RepID=UPI0027DA5A51|nr:uncharacterized protein LOC131892582 [Tigriopus californicus]
MTKPKLLVHKVHPQAKLPSFQSPEAAGMDLFAVQHMDLPPGQWDKIRTGIAVACPHGTYGRIAPRSSIALKSGISVLGGVIDPDYRGELQVLLYNLSQAKLCIRPGDRIAQLILEYICLPQIVETQSLPATTRGSGGFGSTNA